MAGFVELGTCERQKFYTISVSILNDGARFAMLEQELTPLIRLLEIRLLVDPTTLSAVTPCPSCLGLDNVCACVAQGLPYV